MASRLTNRGIFLAALVCAATSLMGQTARPAPAHPVRHTRHAHAAVRKVAAESAKAAAPQPPQIPATPPLPHALPAQPATVKLDHGQLTVEANNSDLGQILSYVASISGMDIEGLKQTTRVFGVYGPGNPGDVLTDLLSGMGYNFVMAGQLPNGLPRELVLTQGGGPLPQPAQTRGSPLPSDDQPDQEPIQYGPGAIQHVPPNMQPGDQDNVQRQEQNLQRLEQMRQQIQQQQQQQQDNPQ